MKLETKYLQLMQQDYAQYPVAQQRLPLPENSYSVDQLEQIVIWWYTQGSMPNIVQSKSGGDLEEIICHPDWEYPETWEAENISEIEVILCVNLWYCFSWIPENKGELLVDNLEVENLTFSKYLVYDHLRKSNGK